jgi:predicted dienelactone hydrolase
MGGVTSLAAAGARMNTAKLRTWCSENPTGAQLNEWACVDILSHEAEMAAFAGLDQAPEGLWPDWRDERIGAAIALAPATIPFGSEGIRSVDVPVMFMVGSGETAADPAFEMAAPYESVASTHKAKIVLDYAEHLMFFSSCTDSPSIVEIGFPMFCSDPVWDMDRGHDLTNHFTTAFLLAELKGDAEAAATLAPEKVSFPGIQYQSTGYGS